MKEPKKEMNKVDIKKESKPKKTIPEGGKGRQFWIDHDVYDRLQKYVYWEREESMSRVINDLLGKHIFAEEYEEIPEEKKKRLK